MNPDADSLANLRDIHLPGAISWWPPALGWWLVLASLAVLLIIGILLLKFIRRKLLRKTALQQLHSIHELYQANQNDKIYINEISKLLRSVAIAKFSRHNVASLYGENWLSFLNDSGNKASLSAELGNCLVMGPYQENITVDSEELTTFAQQWIKTNT